MIAYIDGELAYIIDGHAVVDVGGIGYSINLAQPAIAKLGELMNKTPHPRIRLYTHHHVREDVMLLYGFIHKNELEMFKILIRVSGVGPQTALNILSQILPEDFAMAISREDVGVLSSISGIGAKSAKRLILELKDRIKKEMDGIKTTSAMRQNTNSNSNSNSNSTAYDAICGLVSLGFSKKEAEAAVSAASNAIASDGEGKTPATELLITNALAYMRGG